MLSPGPKCQAVAIDWMLVFVERMTCAALLDGRCQLWEIQGVAHQLGPDRKIQGNFPFRRNSMIMILILSLFPSPSLQSLLDGFTILYRYFTCAFFYDPSTLDTLLYSISLQRNGLVLGRLRSGCRSHRRSSSSLQVIRCESTGMRHLHYDRNNVMTDIHTAGMSHAQQEPPYHIQTCTSRNTIKRYRIITVRMPIRSSR